MRAVFLIGTSHEYQRPHREGSDRFRVLVDATCRQNNVKALAEEMSLDALRLHGVRDSICKQVADVLGIAHQYCDPPIEEQKALGIVPEDDIRMAGFFKGWDLQKREEEAKASSARRRQYWLERLLELDTWPALFVCGADHVEAFRALLETKGIAVNVLFVKWTPNEAL